MAYDEALADRVRELLAAESRVTEQRMFGGLAFLVGGNMAIAASGQGGALVRVDPDETDGLTVSVQDWRTGEAFELTAEPQRAMDVFHHPYAYASRGGAEVAALEDAVYA